MNDHEHHDNNFFSGLVLGALLGAGFFWFLTSTEEGKKVKKQLKEKSQDTLDNLSDIVAELEEKGEEFKQKAKEIQAELEEKVGDVKEEVVGEAKVGLSQIEKLRERGRKAVKFFTRNGKPLV